MKKINKTCKILMLLMIFGIQNSKSQEICGTPFNIPDYLQTVPASLRQNTQPHTVRVFVHIMRASDGSGGRSAYDVTYMMDRLKQDFHYHNICFVLKGIDFIDDDNYFNNFNSYLDFGIGDPNGDGKFENFSPNSNSDAIDIYVYPNSKQIGGLAANIPATSLVIGGTGYLNITNFSSSMLSHEVGHCLGLYHTFHGNSCEPDAASCPELVDGSNSIVCGDFVDDTPADNTQHDVDISDCTTFTGGIDGVPGCGNWSDANYQFYAPDFSNIMAYSPSHCRTYFTDGQGVRMHDFLTNSALLQNVIVNGFDLYGRDSDDNNIADYDAGAEPNTSTSLLYNSSDIWIRNQNDGLTNQNSQSPIYGTTNFVYVRISNRGCIPNNGDEVIELNWAKASTSLDWPTNWNGTLYLDAPTNTALAGGPIGLQTIPVIDPGGLLSPQSILTFTWSPQDPSLYSAINSEPWHFCLLARIVASGDPMKYPEGQVLWQNVKNNNNIFWKNVSVLDVPGIVNGGLDCSKNLMERVGVAVGVGNPFFEAKTYDIKLTVPSGEINNPVTAEGSVFISFDEQLYQKWVQGGRKGTGFTEVLSPPMTLMGLNNNHINSHSPIGPSNRKMFQITGPVSTFENISMEARAYFSTSLMVVFPTAPVSITERFKYDVQQIETNTTNILGGVQYNIVKPDCNGKAADAGMDQVINKGCKAILAALDMPCTSYWWLEENGNVISQNQAVFVSPNHTTTYKLVTISGEGCVSEDYVTISTKNEACVKQREIIKVSPNPAKERISVEYRAENTSNAHLRIVKADNSVDQIFVVDLTKSQMLIDISTFSLGVYYVNLVCDGTVQDSKTIVVE